MPAQQQPDKLLGCCCCFTLSRDAWLGSSHFRLSSFCTDSRKVCNTNAKRFLFNFQLPCQCLALVLVLPPPSQARPALSSENRDWNSDVNCQAILYVTSLCCCSFCRPFFCALLLLLFAFISLCFSVRFL